MRKYELILEDENYNRLKFVDADLYMLCKFMEDAMNKTSSIIKATVSIIEEEVKADDNL